MNHLQPSTSASSFRQMSSRCWRRLTRLVLPLFAASLILSCVHVATMVAAGPSRQMELLNRGLVAVSHGDDGVFLSWRWLGNESDKTAFNVYVT